MKPVTLALVSLLVSGLMTGQGFSQAAAESVLTHGLASGAGSTLGKTLGNTIGNAAGQVGTRLGQQTSTAPARQRIQTVKTNGATTAPTPQTATAASASGSLIASIQGGTSSTTAPACKPAVTSETATPPDSHATTVEKSPLAKSTCVSAADANSHPAVVNLPPAN